jgi:DNA-3-methyladenine glycosylase II
MGVFYDMRWMRGSRLHQKVSPGFPTWPAKLKSEDGKPAHDGFSRLILRMTLHLESQAELEDAIQALLKLDPRLQPVFAVAGMPALRRREPGFMGLAHIVCGQQLSTASAAAIWGRLTAAFDPFDPDALRRARADRLGRLGLSAAKIKTLKNLAREIAAERLNLDVLANEEADAAHHSLVSLHGIGPWTADVYLLFCLGHGDAWPAGDLAVQEAVKIGLGLKTRPTAKEMASLAEPWRPMRGAAAHLWWSYYRAIKKREGIIAGTEKANAVSNNVPVAKRS